MSDPDPRWSARRAPAPTRCPECDATPYEPRACPRCALVRCRLCPDPCVGCARLARLRQVLAGETTLEGPGDPRGIDKTLDFVLTLGDVRDVFVGVGAVAVCVDRSRAAHHYVGWAGPGVVLRLMRAMKLSTVRSPLVGLVPKLAPYRAEPSVLQLAWLLPREDGLELRFRPRPDGLEPFAPRLIPRDGPLALPAPVEVVPFAPRIAFVTHPHDVACPHCTRAARTHRDAGAGWVVCAGCGRSFRPGR